ncbi:MAG TPA: D-alanyl-D-alanine carboxypeptidase family protein [Nitrospiraceae bacterium]|nr:D-alanyl-D-alanine carboxypeptidase family protein [Nitrospiraceae bacterium]
MLAALLQVFTPTNASTDASAGPLVSSAGYSDAIKPFSPIRRHRSPAHGILLKDLATGRTLYEFQSDRRLSPASLTKIMSALVILEYGNLEDTVTVSRMAAAAPKIRLKLRAGQVFRLEDLLKAMLITSANDACLAAVEHVAGSEERFVLLMNTKANALGLVDTHFTNACGFDGPDHYTTAGNLATLSEIALQHPIFKAFVRQERDVIYTVNGSRFYFLRNTNRLLGRLPGVEGVKTGFTSKAGRCLVAKVSQNGNELLLILLHTSRRWNTAASLITYGFQVLENRSGVMP